jgi:hypothetical protein
MQNHDRSVFVRTISQAAATSSDRSQILDLSGLQLSFLLSNFPLVSHDRKSCVIQSTAERLSAKQFESERGVVEFSDVQNHLNDDLSTDDECAHFAGRP